jgi:uncharacterized protein
LHDACRLDDGTDPGHGRGAASLARRMHAEGWLPLDDEQLETLAAALTEHDRGVVADDPTVGACWDADRLHLVRLGVRVRLDLLSTDAARDLARERGIAA